MTIPPIVSATGAAGSPSGPHIVHFSPVKEVVEIESGRFEFFKQMLTIGLGGIAGLAAIFTEPDKIPEATVSKITLSLFALAALVAVLFSAMGISTYANHLRDVEKLSKNPADPTLKANVEGSGQSILSHAKVALVAMMIGALALIIFAGFRLLVPQGTRAEEAMRMAQKIISEQPEKVTPKRLEHFQATGSEFIMTYVAEPGDIKYTVRTDQDASKVLEITKQ